MRSCNCNSFLISGSTGDELDDMSYQPSMSKMPLGSSPRPVPAPRPSQTGSSNNHSPQRSKSSNFGRGRPLRDKKRSYTTSILVSPRVERRTILPPRQRSMDETFIRGFSICSGDVTVDVRKGQFFLGPANKEGGGSTDRLDQREFKQPPKQNHRHSLHNPPDNKLCLESVGLLFSGADVSYV
jgi:hypothetical protein